MLEERNSPAASWRAASGGEAISRPKWEIASSAYGLLAMTQVEKFLNSRRRQRSNLVPRPEGIASARYMHLASTL
ncbi:MAG TPA: hypothetical protein VIK33_07275, partial [Anaerolineae bacterium]